MRINRLSFKFDRHSDFYFFKDLSVEFVPNTLNFITGTNGVGKSTFFSLLQGTAKNGCTLEFSLTLQGSTYVTVNNTFPLTLRPYVRAVQQNYSGMLAEQFSAIENLQLANLPAYPSLRCLPNIILSDMFDLLSIDQRTPVRLLSGGQRQLLALLMTLQKPTRLLLLDEPTAALDPKNALSITKSLQTLAAQLGVTMLIICHDNALLAQQDRDCCFIIAKQEEGIRTIRQIGTHAPLDRIME